MPFGLCNTTETFERLMIQALASITKKFGNLVTCYVVDVVIATSILTDHIDRLNEVFDCMKKAGLKFKPSKCEINKVPGKNRRQAWLEAGSGCCGSHVNMERPQDGHTIDELPRICELMSVVHKRIRRQSLSDAATDAQKREEV